MIGHVALEVLGADVPAAERFWAVLGFARVRSPDGLGDRVVWLARGDAQIHLLLSEDPVVPGAGHMALVVEAYDETVAALRAAGFGVRPRAEHWGAPRAFASAPGGHRVELMARAP